ncbi:hypothetical protein AX15_001495 [Amanita polypyramis BW_CC]|nr:hypothetical protein AX15_001495 [Amanita polypyramis BW_CC]
MSDHEGDVKPKLNLIVSFEKQQITVKVKATMRFSKIFEAAEKRFQKESGTLRFVYDGQRISDDDTPARLEMEDGDQIDAMMEQVGGKSLSL